MFILTNDNLLKWNVGAAKTTLSYFIAQYVCVPFEGFLLGVLFRH